MYVCAYVQYSTVWMSTCMRNTYGMYLSHSLSPPPLSLESSSSIPEPCPARFPTYCVVDRAKTFLFPRSLCCGSVGGIQYNQYPPILKPHYHPCVTNIEPYPRVLCCHPSFSHIHTYVRTYVHTYLYTYILTYLLDPQIPRDRGVLLLLSYETRRESSPTRHQRRTKEKRKSIPKQGKHNHQPPAAIVPLNRNLQKWSRTLGSSSPG